MAQGGRVVSTNIILLLVACLLINALLGVGLMYTPDDMDGYLLWTRYTARIAFCYFILAYTASTLTAFSKNKVTLFLRKNRRGMGLAFALALTIHFVALSMFYIISGEELSVVTVIFGGLGYLAAMAMAATSFDSAVRKLGYKNWHRLHSFGANYLVLIFVYTYTGALFSYPLTATPMIYWLLAGTVWVAFLARLYRYVTAAQSPAN